MAQQLSGAASRGPKGWGDAEDYAAVVQEHGIDRLVLTRDPLIVEFSADACRARSTERVADAGNAEFTHELVKHQLREFAIGVGPQMLPAVNRLDPRCISQAQPPGSVAARAVRVAFSA